MEHIANESNLYAMQTNLENPPQQDSMELSKFLRILLKMSVIGLPRSRLYWSKAFGITEISNVMSRDRFETIKRSIQCNDNTHIYPGMMKNLTNFSKFDLFWIICSKNTMKFQ